MKNLVIYSALVFFAGMCVDRLIVINIPQAKAEKEVIEVEKLIVQDTCFHSITEEILKKEIKKYNFKFPHIVFAQALQETGLNSKNLEKHNNLFGMKPARSRLTNSKSSKETIHAVYDDWRESLFDRALYEATYLRNIKTEEDYYSYLGRNYASDDKYEQELKKLAKKWNT